MPPKVKGQSKMLSVNAVDKKLAELVPARMEAFLQRTAADAKSWASAKKDPKKFLAANGFNVEMIHDITFGEELKVPPGLPVFPIKRCPIGFHAVLRLHRERVCLRWVEITIWYPRPPFPGFPYPFPLHFRICLFWGYIYMWEWFCQRDRLIPIPQPIPKPRIPKPGPPPR